MVIILFSSFYRSCFAPNHSLAFKVGTKCKYPICIHGVVKQYSHVLSRPHYYALYWTKISCTKLTRSALLACGLNLLIAITVHFLCGAKRKLGKETDANWNACVTQKSTNLAIFLPDMQDFCG
jgi:hypothetical protein